jgi:hypothetical protein
MYGVICYLPYGVQKSLSESKEAICQMTKPHEPNSICSQTNKRGSALVK